MTGAGRWVDIEINPRSAQGSFDFCLPLPTFPAARIRI
jgi:hypothetical protein